MAKAKPRARPENHGGFLAPALGLIALTLAVYAGVWSFGFVQFDDPLYVYQNKHIADGLTWSSIQWAFTTAYATNWHPVTWLSHMLDVQLFGLAPGPAHVVNLLLHIGNVLLLFWFLFSTTRARGASAFVAALFAVHPLHVESVAWVSERKDVLSTFFWMLTLVAYVRYVRRPELRRYLLMAACFAIGLMAKPMLVTLPFVFLLIDWWPLNRITGADLTRALAWWPLVREKLPLLVLVATSSVATVIAQGMGGAVVGLEVIPLGLRIQNAIVSYLDYLVKTVWPASLHMYYPYPSEISPLRIAIAAGVLLAITAVVIALSKKRPYAAVGWFWYVGTLVPVIGIMQVGRQSMADRYTYVPLVGIFIIVAFGAAEWLARVKARRWLAPALAAAVLLPSVVVARAQTQHWRNDQTLWSHALQIESGLDARRAAMATEFLLREGEVVKLQTLLVSRASGGSLAQPLVRQYLGRLFARHDQLEDAVAMFQDAVRLGPAVAEFHSELATVFVRQGRLDAATEEFRQAVRLAPDSPASHRNLAVALIQAGRNEEAAKELQEALRLRPDASDVRQALTDLLKKIGK